MTNSDRTMGWSLLSYQHKSALAPVTRDFTDNIFKFDDGRCPQQDYALGKVYQQIVRIVKLTVVIENNQ